MEDFLKTITQIIRIVFILAIFAGLYAVFCSPNQLKPTKIIKVLFFIILLSSMAIAQEQQKSQEVISEKDSLKFQYLDTYIKQLRQRQYRGLANLLTF